VFQAWRDKDGRIVGRSYRMDGTHVVELDGVARFEFGADSAEVLAVPAENARDDVISEYFRRWILPVAVQVRGVEVLHASAVLSSAGVAAFAAASEAGKSTLAYGLGERGYGIWTDDALAFDVPDGRPHALPLPFRLRLRPGSAVHFGLAPHPGGTIAAERYGDVDAAAPIIALFLLERRGDGPAVQIEPLAARDSLPLLVEQSYHFGNEESDRKRAMLARYLTLASAVPVFRLRMATGLAHIDAVLDAVEETLA
jgi:hypothetical protein